MNESINQSINQSIIPGRHAFQGATNPVTWPLAMGCGKEGPDGGNPKIARVISEIEKIVAVLVLPGAAICHIVHGLEVGLNVHESGDEVANHGVNHR